MTFDKNEYWKRRNNTVKQIEKDDKGKDVEVDVPKPLRGQGDLPIPKVTPNEKSKAEISFGNHGEIIVKNRAFRRRQVKLPGESSYTTKTITKEERKKLRKKGRR